MMRNKRVGLVLGAGGVLGGAWLAGALTALRTVTGWDPAAAHVMLGTSAGSVLAALLAGGVAAARLLPVAPAAGAAEGRLGLGQLGARGGDPRPPGPPAPGPGAAGPAA